MERKFLSNNKKNQDKIEEGSNNAAFSSINNVKNHKIGNIIFTLVTSFAGYSIIILLFLIFITLLYFSRISIMELGFKFLYSKEWDPVSEKFGALPFFVGTILTSIISLLISMPFSLAITILLGEYYRKGIFANFLKSMTELLAGIPSVIYGFWGLAVLVPIVRAIEIKLNILPYGVGIFTASLILSIMIIPYSASLGREVLELVPQDLKEAAYSLGATRYEVIKTVILPYAKSGIIAGFILSLGRALGETMAVTMLIGNSNFLPKNIFSPGNTMASIIANEFTEATAPIHSSVLIEIGLLLVLVTAVINIFGKIIIKKFSVR